MTAFSDIMDTLDEAERGARLWDGDKLRAAAARLSELAAVFPPDQCRACGHDAYYHRDVGDWFHVADVSDRAYCTYGDGPVVISHDGC